jgi:ArsR family transcriptional regulator
MCFSKSHLFRPNLQVISHFANGLSHPARIQILEFLSRHPESTIADISIDVPLSRTTISHHVGYLLDLKILTYRERIPFIYYSICWEKLESFLEVSNKVLSDITSLKSG